MPKTIQTDAAIPEKDINFSRLMPSLISLRLQKLSEVPIHKPNNVLIGLVRDILSNHFFTAAIFFIELLVCSIRKRIVSFCILANPVYQHG